VFSLDLTSASPYIHCSLRDILLTNAWGLEQWVKHLYITLQWGFAELPVVQEYQNMVAIGISNDHFAKVRHPLDVQGLVGLIIVRDPTQPVSSTYF
jgi:hypothetical protein